MANSQRERILPPYVQRVDDLKHRSIKLLLILILVASAMFLGFWLAIFSVMLVQPMAVVMGVLVMVMFWMLPDTSINMQQKIRVWFLWFMGVLLFWPQYLAIEIPGLPWITPGRLLMGIVLLFFMFQFAQSAATRKDMRRTIGSVNPAFWFLGLFWGMAMLTLPMARSPGGSFGMVLGHLVNWNLPMVFALYAMADRKVTMRFYWLMLVIVGLTFVLTTFEYRVRYPIWAPHIPSFLAVEGPTLNNLLNGQIRVGEDRYRAKGTFAVHLYYTQFMLLIAPFITHWAVTSGRKWRPLAIALLVYLWVAIWFTNTRTGTTGLIVLTVAYGLMFGLRRFVRPQSKSDLLAPALLAAAPVAALGVFVAILASPRLQAMTLGGAQHQASNIGRDRQWDKAWDAVLTNPIGHGAGSAGPAAGRLGNDGIWIIDSMWINFLVDYGVLGAIGMVGFLLCMIFFGVKAYLRQHDEVSDLGGPAAVSMFGFMLTLYTISFQGNFQLALVIAAIIVTATYRLQKEAPEQPRLKNKQARRQSLLAQTLERK